MANDMNLSAPEKRAPRRAANNAASMPVYGLGFVAALIYYLQHATTFWIGVLGFLKAIVWPAVVVYKLLEFLKM